MKKTVFKVFGYLLFAILFSLLVIILEFPYPRAKAFLEKKIQKQSQLLVTIQELGFAWPMGLAVKGLNIAPPEKADQPYYTASETTFALRPLSLFTGKVGSSLRSDPFQGALEVACAVGTWWKKTKTGSCDMQWSDIQLTTYPYLDKTNDYINFRGAIQGDFHFTGAFQNFKTIQGEGSFNCAGLDLTFDFPLVTVYPVEDLHLALSYRIDKQSLKITESSFKATDVDGTLQGHIVFKKPIESSRLRLEGRIKINPDMLDVATLPKSALQTLRRQKPIRFKLVGTLNKPIFQLS